MINLSKGGTINLSKSSPGTSRFIIGLGWTPDTSAGEFDADASAFGLSHKGSSSGSPQLLGDTSFVFYNNLVSPCGGITHRGDERTGGHAGSDRQDDEQIIIDTSKLDGSYDEISFVVSIYESTTRKQNFGQVKDAYIRIIDEQSHNELARYNLGSEFTGETAVQFGSLSKDSSNHWTFTAIGKGYHPDASKGFSGELSDFVKVYGGHLQAAA